MKYAIIIQARLGSTRLPNKMMLDFYDKKGILEILIDRIIESNFKLDIIVATTINKVDDVIENLALSKGILVYRGDENNVLKRYIYAAEKYGVSKIIRVCADNPFIDMDALNIMINNFEKTSCDYWCYSVANNKPTILTHFGFWAEATTLNALKLVSRYTNEAFYLEHVTNFIYSNPDKFSVCYNLIDSNILDNNDIRLTIDTIGDFNTAKKVYKALIISNTKITAMNVLKVVKGDKKLSNQMKLEIMNNEK